MKLPYAAIKESLWRKPIENMGERGHAKGATLRAIRYTG